MLLQDKNAVIYGGGGSIGGAVARTFGREGARVFLAGRTPAKLEVVADDIRSAGGAADTAEVDALDEKAVDEHADAVAAEAGIARHLVQPDHAPGGARHPARRDEARRFHDLDRDRFEQLIPHLEGGGAAHDPAGIRE